MKKIVNIYFWRHLKIVRRIPAFNFQKVGLENMVTNTFPQLFLFHIMKKNKFY